MRLEQYITALVAGLEKTTRWLLALPNFPLLMSILPVKSPCTLTIIARGAPFVLIVIAGHGGCCQVFVIWVNRLCGHPFWKLIYWLLGCVTIRTMYLWPAIFLNIALITTLVTFPIWFGKWPFSRATIIYAASALEINLLWVNNIAVFSQRLLSK